MKKHIIFVDVETTGTNSDIHEIIDIGAIKADYNTLEVLELMEYKIHPTHINTANRFALQVNGYNESHWNNVAVDLTVAMNEFKRISENAIPCGHNVGFDLRFILTSFRRLNIQHNMLNAKIDTMKLSKSIIPSNKINRYTLHEVCSYLDLPTEAENRHEALNGAKAAYNVFATLRELKLNTKFI